MANESALCEVFASAGFTKTSDTKRSLEFRCGVNGRYIYVNKDRLPEVVCVYIEDALPAPSVVGARIVDGRIRFRSCFTHFPTKLNNSKKKNEEHYGIGIELENSASLSDLLKWFNTLKI